MSTQKKEEEKEQRSACMRTCWTNTFNVLELNYRSINQVKSYVVYYLFFSRVQGCLITNYGN